MPTLAQGESELEVVPAWQGGGEMGWVQWEGRPAGREVVGGESVPCAP